MNKKKMKKLKLRIHGGKNIEVLTDFAGLPVNQSELRRSNSVAVLVISTECVLSEMNARVCDTLTGIYSIAKAKTNFKNSISNKVNC